MVRKAVQGETLLADLLQPEVPARCVRCELEREKNEAFQVATPAHSMSALQGNGVGDTTQAALSPVPQTVLSEASGPSVLLDATCGVVVEAHVGEEEQDEKEETQAMTLSQIRSALYPLARWLGDLNAILKGKIGCRIGRRIAGKASGKMFRRLFG